MLLPSGFILSHHFFSHYMLFMDVIIPMPSAAILIQSAPMLLSILFSTRLKTRISERFLCNINTQDTLWEEKQVHSERILGNSLTLGNLQYTLAY